MIQALKNYRVYFIDEANHIQKVSEVAASSDGEATDLAFNMLSSQLRWTTIELWEGKRKVFRYQS